jgi:hypothetical protein
MIDHPDIQGSNPGPTPAVMPSASSMPGSEPRVVEGKLILPAIPDEDSSVTSGGRSGRLYGASAQYQQLKRPVTTSVPAKPLAKLRYFWGKDPAYKVLMIAIGVVAVAGLVSLSLVSLALVHNPNLFGFGNTAQTAPAAASPVGTVDLRPSFPTPSGGKGSTSSSQPVVQGTPVIVPTVTPQLSPTPSSGTLTIQILSIPNRAQNHTVVNVLISTSEPNVTAWLYIQYTTYPYISRAGPVTTDGNGNATIPWSVNLFFVNAHTRATVHAIARDQNGQQAQSSFFTVQITSVGGGG